jgi:hypothetical protein
MKRGAIMIFPESGVEVFPLIPFLVTMFGLPVYTISGVAFYTLIAPIYADTGLAIALDRMFGALFGAGGFFGHSTSTGFDISLKIASFFGPIILCK